MTSETKSLLAVALLLVAGAPMADEEAPLVVPVQRLTLETALRVAQGALGACRRQGIQIAATVVDRDGTVQVALRDTIAAPLTLEISRQKAYTAANFNASTAALAAQADSPVGRVDGLVMSAGGLPIQVAGALLGAVGVSGAPSGQSDAACAKAGVEAVMEELEMGM